MHIPLIVLPGLYPPGLIEAGRNATNIGLICSFIFGWGVFLAAFVDGPNKSNTNRAFVRAGLLSFGVFSLFVVIGWFTIVLLIAGLLILAIREVNRRKKLL